MTQTEALKQLREVHAIQGRDGCWDIDDYMLGLYNGLELALSIVENRECRYKQRPKEPEQEPVAWMNEEMDCIFFDTERPEPFAFDFWKPLYTTPPQRTFVGLTDEEINEVFGADIRDEQSGELRFIRAIEAKLKELNT